MKQLTEYELAQLLAAQSLPNRQLMARLLQELRELREQAGERERMAADEQVL